MWLIFQSEVRRYFTSPLAYVLAAAFLLLTALLFNGDLAFSVGFKAPEAALIPSFLSLLMVFFAPLLTMRLLAEEQREGTLELLLTAPVKDREIVFGKFLSAWFYYSLLLTATLLYQIILVLITTPDLGHTIAAYLGIWLYGGAALAVGLTFSALTESHVIAAFLATTALLLLWLGDVAGAVVSNLDLARVLRTLSLQGHFSSSFAVGLLRAEDVAYYAGVIVVALFLTVHIVASHRWRG